ncbi:hypothetical protein MBLNU459_g4524t1 [Dothideomycetes sp. NU459]
MSEKAVFGPDCAIAPSAIPIVPRGKHGERLPQAIAHRGYKVKFPENTMGAFAGAVDVGAHAIETDVHITKDDVVVLSHDATLKRCFGRPEKLIDCDWSFVSTLTTLKEPHQRMPRLFDLLEYLARPENEEIWLLLDIKMDNDPDDIMRLIASTIASVAPSSNRPWQSRVVLGCWAAKYLSLASHYLPGFPISHIGFSTAYARQFLSVPNVSFNMLLPILMAYGGKKFIADCAAAKRPVFAWTVNDEEKMEWCIRSKIDGVLTDDPKLFLEVCKRYDSNSEPQRLSWRVWFDVLKIWLLALVFGILWRNRFAMKR